MGFIGFRIQLMSMATAGQRVIQTLRDELFGHIQELSISFFSKYEAGRLIARIISDVNTIRETINFAVVGTLREILTLIGIIFVMARINLPLTGCCVCGAHCGANADCKCVADLCAACLPARERC